MSFFKQKKRWKILLILIACAIGGFSLYYSMKLSRELQEEERKKMTVWADATKLLSTKDLDNETNLLILEVIQNNTTVPVIIADKGMKIL